MNTFDTPPVGYSAGWYPHPSDPSLRRFWDGEAWTDRTGPDLTEFEERMLALTAASAVAARDAAENVRTIKQILVFCLTVGIVGTLLVIGLSSVNH